VCVGRGRGENILLKEKTLGLREALQVRARIQRSAKPFITVSDEQMVRRRRRGGALSVCLGRWDDEVSEDGKDSSRRSSHGGEGEEGM
jgi:hypothetical protein